MRTKPDAILICGLQNGFIKPSVANLPEKIADFLSAHKLTHCLFTNFVNPGKNGPFVEFIEWSEVTISADIEIVDDLKGFATSVFERPTLSPLGNPKILDYLKSNHINDIYVCGINTDVGVLLAAAELFDKGIRPIVLSDLCGSWISDEYHKTGIKIIERMIKSNLITTKETPELVI